MGHSVCVPSLRHVRGQSLSSPAPVTAASRRRVRARVRVCRVTPRYRLSLHLDVAITDKKRFGKAKIGRCRVMLASLTPNVEVCHCPTRWHGASRADKLPTCRGTMHRRPRRTHRLLRGISWFTASSTSHHGPRAASCWPWHGSATAPTPWVRYLREGATASPCSQLRFGPVVCGAGWCSNYETLLGQARVLRENGDNDDSQSDASSVASDDRMLGDGVGAGAGAGAGDPFGVNADLLDGHHNAAQLEQERVHRLQLAGKSMNQLMVSVRGMEGVIEEDARYVYVDARRGVSSLAPVSRCDATVPAACRT